MLYTSQNPTQPLSFKLNDNVGQKFMVSGFNSSQPTKIFSHGFTDNGNRYCSEFVEAYAKSIWDVNLICLDWSAYNKAPLYFTAASNAVAIGKLVGKKIVSKLLIKSLNQSPELIHAIGHSLGAHLSGNVGKHSGDRKIGRITGLDPARPYFENWTHHKERLLETDADFVDVIHTNSGHVHEGCLSMPWAMGHVDFYPNGGVHMTGCTDKEPGWWNLLSNYQKVIADLILKGGCSHGRANSYYAESIQHRYDDGDYFLSRKCDGFQDHCTEANQLPMGDRLRAEM